MTGIFGILESSATQWYQNVAPSQEFTFFYTVTSVVYVYYQVIKPRHFGYVATVMHAKSKGSWTKSAGKYFCPPYLPRSHRWTRNRSGQPSGRACCQLGRGRRSEHPRQTWRATRSSSWPGNAPACPSDGPSWGTRSRAPGTRHSGGRVGQWTLRPAGQRAWPFVKSEREALENYQNVTSCLYLKIRYFFSSTIGSYLVSGHKKVSYFMNTVLNIVSMGNLSTNFIKFVSITSSHFLQMNYLT